MKKPNHIEAEVLNWNNKFPVDAWWRRKHNVPFMSKAHREISFLDQLFEYYEDKLIEELSKETYKPNTGDFLRKSDDKKSIIEQMREEFESEFLDG